MNVNIELLVAFRIGFELHYRQQDPVNVAYHSHFTVTLYYMTKTVYPGAIHFRITLLKNNNIELICLPEKIHNQSCRHLTENAFDLNAGYAEILGSVSFISCDQLFNKKKIDKNV